MRDEKLSCGVCVRNIQGNGRKQALGVKIQSLQCPSGSLCKIKIPTETWRKCREVSIA